MRRVADMKKMPTTTAKLIVELVHRIDLLERESKRPHSARLSVHKFLASGDSTKERRISGIASNSDTDRTGEVVSPGGGFWQLPLPLLHSHDHACTIGSVTALRASTSGIYFEAKIATGTQAAEDCWKLLQQGHLSHVSIGFRSLERTPIKTGWRHDRWELLEISVVPVPALPSARVTAVGDAKQSTGSVKLLTTGGAVPLIRGGQ